MFALAAILLKRYSEIAEISYVNLTLFFISKVYIGCATFQLVELWLPLSSYHHQISG